ncbi:hypothetical protein K449DRAFT_360782, partial [Hypoxylon sp. EC38]
KFLSKSFRVHLKQVIFTTCPLPSTRCSFTAAGSNSTTDLDPRSSILFSQISWLVTIPE